MGQSIGNLEKRHRESLNAVAFSANQASIGRSLPQLQHEVKSFVCDSPQREQVQAVDSEGPAVRQFSRNC